MQWCQLLTVTLAAHAGPLEQHSPLSAAHLHDLCHALQAHACVNVLGSKGRQDALSITVQLHKHLHRQ
jgi:hypothetical protein